MKGRYKMTQRSVYQDDDDKEATPSSQATVSGSNSKDQTIGSQVGAGIDKFNSGVGKVGSGIGYAGATAVGLAGVGVDAVKGVGKLATGAVKTAGNIVKGVGGLAVNGVKAGVSALHDKGTHIMTSSVSKSSAKPNASVEKSAIQNKDQVLDAQQSAQQGVDFQKGVQQENPNGLEL